MFEVGVTGQFEAAHRLRGDFGPATRLHGHTYRVEVAVRGDSLRADGTLCDIAVLQQALDAALADLHYQNLDEVERLAGRNTTAEVVAQVLCEQIAPALSGAGLRTLAVRIWESPRAYASHERDL
jgi:6-pyruvoyltetrahydropterin/6-carboxytetrahydropterin synthase